jgi:methylenetetrahydrofolate reductase (NADPH)
VQSHIDNRMYYIEVLSPRQNTPDLEDALVKFAEKYRMVHDAGHIICIPENPMGNLAFQGTELIQELGLPVNPAQVSIHLNTFHTKGDVDWILGTAADMGIRHVLVISGDGSERQPKLRGPAIDMDVQSVTSVELLRYIHREFPGQFDVGVAFNPYEPPTHEFTKLQHKIDAGAASITTQPILGEHKSLEKVLQFGLPVVVEAWMSKRLHLLSECVGYEISVDAVYDPMENLSQLIRNYPGCGFYLSMLGFKSQFPHIDELWK